MKLSIVDILEYVDKDTNQLFQPTEEMLIMAKESCSSITSDIMKEKLGRKWKSKILNLYPLLLFVKNYVGDDNVVYISQKNKVLLSKYNKCQVNIYDNIQYLIQGLVLHMLPLPYLTKEIARQYYVSQDNLELMLSIYKDIKNAEENKIIKKVSGGSSDDVIADTPTFKNLNAYFNANLRINVNKYTEEDIANSVYYHYPLIPYYQYLTKFMNHRISNPNEKIRFNLSFKYSESLNYITKISIRATNDICPKKSYEKQEKKCKRQNIPCIKDETIQYREDYLNERFGEYEEYDIKASVPRVAHCMAFDDGMGDLKEDLYKKIFEKFTSDYAILFNPQIIEWNEEVRGFFKSIFMRLYFGGSPSQIKQNILESERKFKEKQQLNRIDYPITFTELDEKGFDLVGMLTKWQNAVYEYCPHRDKKDTTVFLDESCIYLEVRKMLYRMGVDVVQVYDGFYFKKGTMPPNMDEIVSLCADIYKAAPRLYFDEENRDDVINYADYIEQFMDVDYQNDIMEKMSLGISDEHTKKIEEIVKAYKRL